MNISDINELPLHNGIDVFKQVVAEICKVNAHIEYIQVFYWGARIEQQQLNTGFVIHTPVEKRTSITWHIRNQIKF